MDWASISDPCITQADLGTFRYDKKRSEESNVPTVLWYQSNKFGTLNLDNQEAWERWFRSDIFRGEHLNSSHPHSKLSGFQILVSPHVEPVRQLGFPGFHARGNPNPVLSGDLHDDETGPEPLPQTHNSLPFSEINWSKVIKAFMIPRSILHPIRRNKCQSTFVACSQGGADLELHTAVAAPFNRPGSFSLSCTYFEAPKLTLAVLYSCDSTQLRRITQLLRGSPEVASHPLLMVGVFAELQLNRMEQLASRVHRLCDHNRRHFDTNSNFKPAILIKELNDRLRTGIIMAREAEEEMRAVKAQIKEMADRIDDQEAGRDARAAREGAAGPAGPNAAVILNRFKGRFNEIDKDLDGLMSQCRTAAEGQSYSGELLKSEIQRQDAGASRRQGIQSKFLALIATIFLPVTSVATIFAVPAFKFDNAWLDVRFQSVNGSDSENGSLSSSNSPSPNPVFSGYGIIFIVISVSLTCFTYYTYRSAKRRLEENDELAFMGYSEEHQHGAAAAGKRPRATTSWQSKETGGSSFSGSPLARLRALEAGFLRSWRARPWFPGKGEKRQPNNRPGGSPV